MSSGNLTRSQPTSEAFDFLGDCYILLKGSGTALIERSMNGKDFEVLTNNHGEQMVFLGDGVLFNGSISCNKRLKHRITAETTSSISYEIVKERG